MSQNFKQCEHLLRECRNYKNVIIMKGIAKRKIQKCNTFFPIHFVFLQTPSPNLSPWSQNLGAKTPLLPVAHAPNLSAFLTPETPGQLPESSAKDFCRYVFLHAQV